MGTDLGFFISLPDIAVEIPITGHLSVIKQIDGPLINLFEGQAAA